MRADGAGADEIHAQRLGSLFCFRVEVVQHFHMIGDESDRDDDDVFGTLRGQLAKMIVDVGFEPGLRWRAAAALIDELPGSGCLGGWCLSVWVAGVR